MELTEFLRKNWKVWAVGTLVQILAALFLIVCFCF